MTRQKVVPKSSTGISRKQVGMALLCVLGFALFVLFMAPFFVVIYSSAKTSAEISLDPFAMPSNWGQLWVNIKGVYNNPNFEYFASFRDSVIITAASLIVIVIASAMAAWVLVRNKTRWSNVLFMIFVASMVIPFQVVMLPLVQWLRILGNAIGLQLTGTYKGIVLCYLGFGAPLSIFIFHGFIKGIPYELEEAGDILSLIHI